MNRPRVRFLTAAAAALVLLAAGCVHGGAVPAGRAATDADLAEARAAAEKGDWPEAARLYDAALARDRTRLAAHRGRVEAAFNTGRLAQVEDAYRAVLARSPEDPFALYGLALARYAGSTSNGEEALSLLARAEAARPGEADLPYRRGLILLDAERWEEAKTALGRAVSLAPKVARYRVPYALALFHAGDAERALEALKGLTGLSPSPAEAAKARDVAGRITDPFRHFPDAARQRVERAIAWLEQADVPQNAIDLLREVLLEHPDAAMVHALLGLAYQRIENGGEAMVELERAIELAPQLPQPHLYLANFFYGRERFADARREYLAALDRNPLLVEAHRMLGQMALEGGDVPGAVEHLRAWALLAPKQTAPQLALARALAAAGDLDGAETALDAALELDPSNLEAHLSLGAILVRRHGLAKGRKDRADLASRARTHLDAVLEAQPENAAALRLMRELGG